MIEISSPADIADANRVKDEAADEAMLEEWLPVARQALLEYRGDHIDVPLPGCIYRKSAVEKRTTVHDTERFGAIVAARFAGTGWATGLYVLPGGPGIRGYVPALVRFREEVVPEPTPEPVDEPEPPPRRSFWASLWGRE